MKSLHSWISYEPVSSSSRSPSATNYRRRFAFRSTSSGSRRGSFQLESHLPPSRSRHHPRIRRRVPLLTLEPQPLPPIRLHRPPLRARIPPRRIRLPLRLRGLRRGLRLRPVELARLPRPIPPRHRLSMLDKTLLDRLPKLPSRRRPPVLHGEHDKPAQSGRRQPLRHL